MLHDRPKKGNNANERPIRGERKKEQSPPIMRSPALESAERQERQGLRHKPDRAMDDSHAIRQRRRGVPLIK